MLPSHSIFFPVYFDFCDDEVMNTRKRKFLSLTDREGLLFMRQRGYEHVQVMIEEGKLDALKEAGLSLAQKEPVKGSNLDLYEYTSDLNFKGGQI